MCEPLYGFPSNMPAQEFVKVKGTTDLFYTYDEELDVNKLLSESLPPPSIAINVSRRDTKTGGSRNKRY
jgi:hypothetical protein